MTFRSGLVLLSLLCVGFARGQSLPASQPTTAAASQPTSVPADDVADYDDQLDAVNNKFKSNDAFLGNAGPDPAILRDLPALTAEITARLTDNGARLNPLPSLDVLDQLIKDWQDYDARISAWQAQTRRRGDDLLRLDKDLAGTGNQWRQIVDKVAGNADRKIEADKVIATVQKQHERFAAPIKQVRDLQNRLDDLADRVKTFEQRLNEAKNQALRNLFVRDCPPFWDLRAFGRESRVTPRNDYGSLRTQWVVLRTYLSTHVDNLWLHAGLIVALSLAARWMSRRSDEWTIRDADGAWHLSVLKLPTATGLALSLLAGAWLYPNSPPRLLWVIIGAASLAPLYLLLRRATEPRVRPLLRLFMVLWLTNNTLELLPNGDVLTRVLQALEVACGALFLSYYAARALRPQENDSAEGNRRRIFLLLVTRLSIAVLVASLLTNLFGLFALARLLTRWLLTAAFIAMVVRAGTRVLIALMIGAMHVWPLEGLRLVRDHRALMQSRLRMVLSLAGVWLWWIITLNALSIRLEVMGWINDVREAPIPGLHGLSLGAIVEFGLTVAAAFLISRFIRFILKEDVYPRVKLARGVPYAITTLTHYSVLLIGLLFALANLNVEPTKFTILVSAFGVGIGFGLQNVVNNFVSGLLLLFERPVQVGDVVELDGGYIGSVTSIGIRASIVRTIDAAEVIVPNSLLISNRVINWTFSTRQRGFTLPVTVVAAPDPQVVLNALLDAAAQTRLVLQSPRPQAYLVEFSPGVGVKFEVRVWTAQFEDWVAARSDLAVNFTKACNAAGIQVK